MQWNPCVHVLMQASSYVQDRVERQIYCWHWLGIKEWVHPKAEWLWPHLPGWTCRRSHSVCLPLWSLCWDLWWSSQIPRPSSCCFPPFSYSCPWLLSQGVSPPAVLVSWPLSLLQKAAFFWLRTVFASRVTHCLLLGKQRRGLAENTII